MDDSFNVVVFPPGKFKLAALSEEIIQIILFMGLPPLAGHKLIQKYNQQRQKNFDHEENKKIGGWHGSSYWFCFPFLAAHKTQATA